MAKSGRLFIGRLTFSSLREDAANGSSEAEASAGVFTTISMDSSSRALDQCDSTATLSNIQYTEARLDIAGLATGFDMSIKDFDLECEKLCLLLGDSGIRSPARYTAGVGNSQQECSGDCGQQLAVSILMSVQ
jgi:hypothetical protein